MYFRSIVLIPLAFLCVLQAPQDSIRKHYEAAETRRREGNLRAAEAEYTAILGEGYSKLGKVYSAEQEYIKARAALEAAATYDPTSQAVLLDLAIAYFNTEQYDKTREVATRMLTLDRQSVAAHHLTGKAYFMVGDFAKSTSELETANKLAPNDYDIAYTLGLAYLKQHQFAPAQKIYDRMIGQLGDRPQLHILFGRAYRETDFLTEAIGEFKKAVALDPAFPRAHYYLGLTLLLKDGVARINDATEEFKIELREHPDEFFANYYLGIAYSIQRQWELATSFLQKASQIEPENPDPYFHLGQAYQAVEKHDLAIVALQRTIALTPSLIHNDYQVTTAHYRLGQSLIKTGHVEEGQKELRIASDLKMKGKKRDEEKTAFFLGDANLHDPNAKYPELHVVEGIIAEPTSPDEKARTELSDSESYYAKVVASAHENIGLLRADQQDFRAAAEQFAFAARWNPQLEDINFNWGLAAFKAQQYKEAITPLETELKAQPGRVAAKQLLGLSYFMLENYARASDLLSQVVAARPNEVTIYYPLAVSLVKQLKMNDAERVIQEMITVGGNNAQVHILLGQAYYEQGQTAKALEELKTALTLDSKTRLAHYYSGQVLLKEGKFDEAAQEFESELALNPNDITAKYHLAFVLLASQKTQRGIELMKEVIRLKPDYAEAHYELGKALFQLGEIKTAVESLETAAKLKPAESYVHYQLGRAYLASGRKADGEKELDVSRQLKEKERSQPTP